MGHATFGIDANNLVELLDILREEFNKHPAMCIENATLVIKNKDGKGYTAVGSCAMDLAIDQTYGKPPKKNLRLILRVSP